MEFSNRNFDPNFHEHNCKNIKNHVIRRFQNRRKKMKNDIEKIKTKISLTIDTWTSNNDNTFLEIIGHYIDEDWTLRRFLLNMVLLLVRRCLNLLNEEKR